MKQGPVDYSYVRFHIFEEFHYRFGIEKFHKRAIVFRSEKRTRLNCNCVYILGINQSFLNEEQMLEAHGPHPSHDTHFFAINEVMIIWRVINITITSPWKGTWPNCNPCHASLLRPIKWIGTSFEQQIWIFKSPLSKDSLCFWKKWFFNVFNLFCYFVMTPHSPGNVCILSFEQTLRSGELK